MRIGTCTSKSGLATKRALDKIRRLTKNEDVAIGLQFRLRIPLSSVLVDRAGLLTMYGRTRYIGIWLLVALHLGAFEWGPALHLWQCSLTASGGHDSRERGFCCGSSTCGGSQALAEAAEPDSPDSPQPTPEPHDPRQCSICKVYAHSAALQLLTEPVFSAEAVQPILIRELPRVVRSRAGVYLARGPPIGA